MLLRKETKQICMEKLVKVDGKVRTDVNYPVGFMDVVEIPKSNDTFRLIFDAKGKFVLHKIDAAEATYKLCRVRSVATTLKKVPYVVTHDSRTIRYPDPLIKVNDVVKVDIATGKIIDFIKFAAGKVAMITKGATQAELEILFLSRGTLAHLTLLRSVTPLEIALQPARKMCSYWANRGLLP